MRLTAIGALIGLMSCIVTSAQAAGRIAYGSRVGMEVTVTSMSGIGSRNAIIRARHTRENAREFCVGYSDDRSEKCIRDVLRNTTLSDEISANCISGEFTTFYGENLRFVGPAKNSSDLGAKFRIVGTDGQLDGSSASGYPYAIEQFRALCPGRVTPYE